jgi:enoyl-CoA hydratase/3-hydroxyacyl-CoA dehydrogenase
VTVDRRGPIAYVTLNRPEKLNAITPEMMDDFADALRDVSEDDSVRVVVVRGEGRAFCCGFDLSVFRSAGSPSRVLKMVRRLQDLNNFLEEMPKPVIASIQGYALGGGLEIALSCDFRFASTSASLGQTEINLGFIPGAGGTQRVTRLAGPAKAKRLIFSGERITSSEALDMGLVDRVFDDAKLADGVEAYATMLSEKPPLALAAAKRAIGEASHPIRSGLDLEAARFALLFSSDDVAEGLSAFFEKRKPQFKGD